MAEIISTNVNGPVHLGTSDTPLTIAAPGSVTSVGARTGGVDGAAGARGHRARVHERAAAALMLASTVGNAALGAGLVGALGLTGAATPRRSPWSPGTRPWRC